MKPLTRKINAWSATALVVANMIGVGAFTTLGLQLKSTHNAWVILLLWLLGGFISLLGAFSYAEIGARLPRSGGEYHFLSKAYHPLLGYLSGWVSLTVGFAAATALAAMAMGEYLDNFLGLSASAIAALAILLATGVHSFSLRQSSNFQNIVTALKVLLVILFIAGGVLLPRQSKGILWESPGQSDVMSLSFAFALVFVTYAYSGWNAAAYIVGEIKKPHRNLPIALIGGTLLVTVLYVGLQLAFMWQADVEQLEGAIDVGQIIANGIFGATGGRWISGLIAFFLISSISAMVWVGPRVTRAMAEDYPLWRFLAKDNSNGIPVRSIWLQASISIFMILTSSFEQVLVYSGFILQLFTSLTVAGVLVLRHREGAPATYKSPFYPYAQYFYLLISIWILIAMIWEQPVESLLGLGNLALGLVAYYWSRE